jgi:hypothetical protein
MFQSDMTWRCQGHEFFGVVLPARVLEGIVDRVLPGIPQLATKLR